MLDKSFNYTENDSQAASEALIRSYSAFTSGSFSEALFEYEDYASQTDTLLMSVKLLRSLVLKDDTLDYSFLPDTIRRNISIYSRIELKSPLLAYSLSAIPGLGEIYAGDYSSAFRDITINLASTALAALAFLKNKDSFAIDDFELSSSYFKSRDYLLTYLIYSSLIVRFQNGSKVNAEAAAERYNNELYKKYLTPLHGFIDSIYRERVKRAIK